MDANATQERATSRFIPLTRQAVIAALSMALADGANADDFRDLALRLQHYRGRFYRNLCGEMRRCYLPFSPDRDAVHVLSFDAAERQEMADRLSDLTRNLLRRANYAEIDTERLNAILNQETPYSLRIAVDLAEYDELQLFARGSYTKHHSVRRPETLYLLKAHYEVRVFRRLFVLLKMKSDEDRAEELAKAENLSREKALKRVRRKRKNLPPTVTPEFIYMKVFKDLPEHDVEILFPLRTVQFRPFDKIKFFATAGGGTLFGVFTTTGKVLAASNPFTLLGALIGFIGLLARQISTFFNQRNRYMMELAQKLFFHNLANNRAALTLLIDRAEEEDVKEDLIALALNAGERVPVSELPSRKARVDALVLERYEAAIDFEMDETVARLEADGVVRREGDTLVFATLAQAAARYTDLLAESDLEEGRHLGDPAPRDEWMEA